MNWNGNWLARDIVYHSERCRRCRGEGLIDADIHDVREEMGCVRKKNYRRLIKIYRDWKANGKQLTCPDCEGRGSHEWKE
jgi:hypothetical protein